MTRTEVEVSKWTPKEFERLVFECRPQVAVFDCDGTLWSGDAGYGFMAWSLEQGLVSRSTTDWIDTRHRAYRAGNVSEEVICGEMVQMYAGLRDLELHAAAAQFFNEFVRPNIFPEMLKLVADLRGMGTEIWAVSSTNRWVIEEGVREFGIPAERVVAAEVRVADGIITSELVDVPTGPAKATALRRIGLPHPDAVFGNSLHDLAMLEMARCPFPVNPSPALIAEATKRGWGYFRPPAAERLDAAVNGE
ncbi:MAG TPA: HAD family hydrolase [Terracidiphilus sp.]|nr:HAD family hydrolase [Terracidiphilus sp.]